jgi:hypothetical protein
MPRMEDDEPFDLEDTWAGLQHAIGGLMVTIGGCAAALANCLIVPRAMRMQILQWLAPAEALARRLILLEALKLPAPNQPAPFVPKGRLANAYADKPEAELPADESEWRVRFHVWSPNAPTTGTKTSAPQAVRSYPIQYNAISLARRVEALRRLYDQREAYAHRLAQRLHHAPARARRAFGPYRYRATAVQTLMRRAQEQVDLALAQLNTS